VKVSFLYGSAATSLSWPSALCYSPTHEPGSSMACMSWHCWFTVADPCRLGAPPPVSPYNPLRFTNISMPINESATCVHCAMSSSTRTTDVSMIFTSVHHHLKASGAEPTFGAISPWPGVLHPIRAKAPLCGRADPVKDTMVCCGRR
jgi:hypothetical protein